MSNCIINSWAFLKKAMQNTARDKLSLAYDNKGLRNMSLDVVTMMAHAGDNRMTEYLGDYNNTTDDLDMVTRYVTEYDSKTGAGHATFDSFTSKADDQTRAAYMNRIRQTIYDVVTATPDPGIYGDLDDMLSSGVALNTMHAVMKSIKYDRTTADILPVFKSINSMLHLYDNPIANFRHWNPGKKAIHNLAVVKEYGINHMHGLMNQVGDMLDKAESMPIFKDNKITRGQINQMLPSMDGLDLSNPNHKQAYASILVNNHGIDHELVDGIVLGLDKVKQDWNHINYGKGVIETGDIQHISENPMGGTIIGYYAGLHKMVKEYYDFVSTQVTGSERLAEVKRILDFTDIRNKIRRDYMPTYDQELYGNLGELYNDPAKIAVASNYRPKGQLDNINEDINFEKLTVANLIANNSMFNKMTMVLAREHLDFEYKASVISGDIDNDYRHAALNSADLFIRKLDAYLDYEPGERTKTALLMKKMDAFGGAWVSGMLGGIRNALNNTFAGRAYTILAGINVGSPAELAKLVKNGKPEDVILAQIAHEKSKNYMSPGIASNFESLPDNVLDQTHSALRKLGDWLGDGGIMSGFTWWKENLTVKGTEENHLRTYVTNMIFLELSERMKLTGLSADNPEYAKLANEITPNIAAQAWTDLSNALGHFDPVNKPFYAHVAMETAETAPKVILGMFAKYWYMFRHVDVTNYDGITKRIRENFGESYDRWNYNDNPNKPQGFRSGGLLHDPKAALGGIAALALFDLVRVFFKKKDPKPGFESMVDDLARVHVPVVDSANPVNGVLDLVRYLGYVAGVVHVDEETHKRYAADAINFVAGMAGGRGFASIIGNERSHIEALSNIVTAKSEWMSLAGKDTIETGFYGENLRSLRRDFRADTAMFRNVWAVDLLATLGVEIGVIGGVFKDVDNKKQAEYYRKETIDRAIGRWSGLAFWIDNWDRDDEVRKKYVRPANMNRYLNNISDKQYKSATKYHANSRSGIAYNTYIKHYYPQYGPAPMRIKK